MRKNYFRQCSAFATQSLSKLSLLTAALIFFTHFTSQATIYNFTSSGNWDNSYSWDATTGCPGFVISAGDTVIINDYVELYIQPGTTVENNGTIITSSFFFLLEGTLINNGNFINSNIGSMTVVSRALFENKAGSTFVNNGGITCLPAGVVSVDNGSLFINNNEIFISPDALLDPIDPRVAGTLSINGVFRNYGLSTFDGIYVNTGTFENNGIVNADFDSPASGTGIFKGKGIISSTHETSFKNTGTLRPDTILTFQFNFTNIRAIEMDLSQPDSSDKIIIENVGFPVDSSGTATLGGTLVVNLKSGYTGHDSVTIITANNLIGTFSSVTLPALWKINYNVPSAGKITLSYDATLPVELKNFQATPLSNSIKLSWQTADEINYKGFQVEKRKSWGDEWESIGFVEAKGNSSTYEFTDDSPLSINYYRLRQMDNDGKSTLSKVVSASFNNSNNLKIYPSIVFDNVLNIENDKIENLSYSIFNILGQPIKTGNTTSKIDISTLQKGPYILKIGTEQAKFIKE